MNIYDIITVGGGPAGLTAALYALRGGKSVLVIEKSAFGGQMTYSPKIENYPGFASASGNEIAEQIVDQVLGQGAEVEFDRVTSVSKGENGIFAVECESGETKYARAVIIANGCRHRRLGLEREEDFIGEGISFCAVCDGAFYKDRDVAVIGGGNSALQEALLLSQTSRRVTVVQDMPHLTGEARLAAQIDERDNIDVLCGYRAESLIGEDAIKGLKIRSASGEEREIAVDGIFVAIGLVPENEDFASLAELDARGYFDSDENCLTSTEGLFVAGDCRKKYIRQITTATADGAVAALAACRYIDR